MNPDSECFFSHQTLQSTGAWVKLACFNSLVPAAHKRDACASVRQQIGMTAAAISLMGAQVLPDAAATGPL